MTTTDDGKKRECSVIKRKSHLDDEHKIKLIDGIAKYRGFAVSLNSILPLISNERTTSSGYLRCLVEELFYRDMLNYGLYNENKKWGCWDTASEKLDPDCCGAKEARDSIAAACGELLSSCITRENIYAERLTRLMETVPFFETAICCIRLARRGLGEDEIRRILYGKKAATNEFKKQRELKNPFFFGRQDDDSIAVSEENDEKKDRQSESVKDGEDGDSMTNNMVANFADKTIMITTEHMLVLLKVVGQVCTICFGKYTIVNLDVQKSIDLIMSKKLADSEETDDAAANNAGDSELVREGSVIKNSTGTDPDTTTSEDNADKWKSFYLQIMIDMFHRSLVSFRKAEELPFLAKYFAKTFDQRTERKKIVKWKESIMKMVLEVEMFYRMTGEMLVDDLVRCLAFCNASPEATQKLLKLNFEEYFGLTVKKSLGTKYENLTEKDVEVSMDRFRENGSKILHSISFFYFKHVNLVKEAQDLTETSLLLNFSAKSFPRHSPWSSIPYDIDLAINTIVLLSSIYLQRVRVCHARLNKRERKAQHAANTTFQGKRTGDKTVRAITQLGSIGHKPKLNVTQKSESNNGNVAAVSDLESSNGIDPLDLFLKLELLHKVIDSFEEVGLTDEQTKQIHKKFDRNFNQFEEYFFELPQGKNHRKRSSFGTETKFRSFGSQVKRRSTTFA